MRIYLGIDPGATGAVVAIDEAGQIVETFPFGSLHDAVERMDSLRDGRVTDGIVLACLEKVQAFPGQGRSSIFSFGTNYGIWQGILASRSIPFELVTPQKWQKAVLSCKPAKGQTKDHVFEWARRRWPKAELTTAKGRRRFEISDALGLAFYALLRQGK